MTSSTLTRTSAAAVRSLLRHTVDALASYDWASAIEYSERAVDADPNNASARLLSFMAHRHLSSLDQLSGVAAQIVAETPATVMPLAQVLDDESMAEHSQHDTTRTLLSQNPQVTAPVKERVTTLAVSRRAFESVFDDEDWVFALRRVSLEDKRAMESARSQAESVFDEALGAARADVAQACAVAAARVPRVTKAVGEAQTACQKAAEELERSNGADDTAVSESFSYLPSDIRTAHVGLWVGVALVLVAAVMLVFALVPGRSSITNPLASFGLLTLLLAVVLLAMGIGLLALRGNLVRSNRRGMVERAEAKASVHERAASHAEQLDDEMAAIRARCRSLETMRLDDDSFEDALSELEARSMVLDGASAPLKPEAVAQEDEPVAAPAA